MGSSLGKMFTVTSFGESHGSCVGVVIDGCPAGLQLGEEDIQREVDKRKPSGPVSTPRVEEDKVEILSGMFNQHTTGAPICLLIWNKDVDSTEYEKKKNLLRPGHADYTAFVKYGGYNDFRGGGRFSGRITASFVMAGAVARKILDIIGIDIVAHAVEIGGIKAQPKDIEEIKKNVCENPLRCGDSDAVSRMLEEVEKLGQAGDSVGGIIEGIAINIPAGLGEPVFDTMEGDLAKALFSIPAVKGVEFGSGFEAARKKGSENNDTFTINEGNISTRSNNAGGILGGISNGMPVVVRVVVKPTPSISLVQETVDINKMQKAEMEVHGRHDTCIVPRAVPVVESMMAVTICDFAIRAGLIPEVIK